MGKPKSSVRPRRATRTSARRKPEPQLSSNCSEKQGRLARKRGPAFLLWHTLPEGPLLRVFELMYAEPRGNDELRSAALVCRAWREAAQEILLGDTAASRPHRAPLPSASEVQEPKQTITTCRAVVLEESRSVSSGNEACSKRRTLPVQNLPSHPHAPAAPAVAEAAAPAAAPEGALEAPWNAAPAYAQLPAPKQDGGEDVSQGGARSEEAGRGPGSRMGMLTRAAAAIAAQGLHAGPSSQTTHAAQAGPSQRVDSDAAAQAAEATPCCQGHDQADAMQEAIQPDTTAAAVPDGAGPSTGRAVYREPPTRRRRQVSLRVILDADPGPPDGGVGAPGGGAKPPPPGRRGRRRQ